MILQNEGIDWVTEKVEDQLEETKDDDDSHDE